jgi:long-chain fatty acid transport protein
MKIKLSFLLINAIVLVQTSHVFAVGSGGIANEVTSAEGLGELLGVTGSKADPSVIYNNPASIGDVEGKFNGSAGLSFFHLSAERNGTNGTSDKMQNTSVVIPNFSYTQKINTRKIAIGVAVISPYGLETKWADDSNVRYVATKSKLEMYDITPAVSYRPSDKWAFGVGADYFNTFDANLQKKAPVDVINYKIGFPTAGSPDANSELSGDGHQWGYHTGVLYNPTPNHTFGVTYHSEVKTKIEGNLELTGLSGASASVFGGTNYKTHARTDLFYPQNVQVGYKYSQGEKWELGFNLAWYDWSSNKQFEIVLPDATPTQRAIAGNPIPLHWRDVWSGTIGGSYRFSETWKLNAGAYYLPNVYPEETFSPAIPDLAKIGISVGPSYTKGSWGIDAVYNPLFYKHTTINNTVGQDSAGPNADISGRYKAMVHIVGVNVKYKFQ